MPFDYIHSEKRAAAIITRGLIGAIRWFAIYVVLAGLVIAVANYFVKGDSRSDMRLHTDALTGCQYLSAPDGGITPRLSANGTQICGGAQ